MEQGLQANIIPYNVTILILKKIGLTTFLLGQILDVAILSLFIEVGTLILSAIEGVL